MPDATRTALTLTTQRVDGQPVAGAELQLTPEFLARYEVGPVLGCGAMGMVCRGLQRSMARPVAIKFLKQRGEQGLARFVREGRALARISHAAVTRVFDTGEVGGHPYLVTELVSGGTLRERMTR